MAKRQLKLGAFMRPVSIHTGAWRYPGAYPDANFNFAHLKQLHPDAGARQVRRLLHGRSPGRAEHADQRAQAQPHRRRRSSRSRCCRRWRGATERIGLVATASTTFDEPYHIARRFASLDHISGGRAGWNIVTTSNPDAALNFGLDEHMEHDERYRRAREFYDVVTGLWDSFADDAFVRDVESGIYFDPAQDACARSQGRVSLGARPAQHRAPGPGLAGDRAGRRVGGRQAARRRDRGSGVHRRRHARRRRSASMPT